MYCQVVDCYEDRPKGCNENQVFNYTTPDANASITIEGLRKYTNYSCRTQVYNIFGAGKFSPPIHVRTAEDSKPFPQSRYSRLILVMCILFQRMNNPHDFVKRENEPLMKRINCSNITIAWLNKKVLSRAHVRLQEQRAKNAHDQNEQTFYMSMVIGR